MALDTPAISRIVIEPYLYALGHRYGGMECRAIARREMLRRLWRRYDRSPQQHTTPRILDVGCGSGATLKALAGEGVVFGTDISPEALRYCQSRGIRNLLLADGASLPFLAHAFDLVLGIDVMEHVEDDVGVLQQIHYVLRSGGLFIGIVPAAPSLWSSRDARLKHRRRYTRPELSQKIQQGGFATMKLAYLDALAFLPFYLWVKLSAVRTGVADLRLDAIVLPKPLNWLLLQLMRVEHAILMRIHAPFGVALLVVARK